MTIYNDPKRRTLVLLGLYEMTQGNPAQSVESKILSDKLGMDHGREFSQIGQYLKQEGLIDYNNFNFINITHKGIKEAEKIMEESYSQTKRRVLEAIADQARMSDVVLFPGLAQRLGMSDRELARYCNALDEQGAINFPGGDVIQMRDAGWEALEPARPSPPSTVHYNMNIKENYGAAAQGSQFTQNVQVKNEFADSVEKLLKAVNESKELSTLQRVGLVSDIQLIQQLGQLERTPEVIAAAETKIDAITSVISTTADLVALGMVVIPIIRAFFGL